ncbi:MAG: hypothetical protein DKT66_23910 [Candidatus Melainabacteria bacterium]|nr:MAG: hypothetical protein DKT66_23910 [Candidatus Melainabacteria bacterium]
MNACARTNEDSQVALLPLEETVSRGCAESESDEGQQDKCCAQAVKQNGTYERSQVVVFGCDEPKPRHKDAGGESKCQSPAGENNAKAGKNQQEPYQKDVSELHGFNSMSAGA